MLSLLPFALGLGGRFAFDDYPNIVDHPSFAAPLDSAQRWWEALLSSGASSIGRPLSVLTFMLNFYFSGLDPYAFKLTNLLLHGVNGLLVYRLLLALFGEPAVERALNSARVSAHATALWLTVAWTTLAVHISAVLMVVQRMEVLAHTLVLLGLICYVAGRQRLRTGQPGAALRIACGLTVLPAIGVLAKESAALLPVYALALEIYLLRFSAASAQGRRALLATYAALAATACILALLLLPQYLEPGIWSNRGFTLSERLLTEPRVLWSYVRWILIPDLSGMSLYHDAYPVSRGLMQPPTTAIALTAWVMVGGLLAWLARRPSLFGLGLCWFLSAHLLTATVFPLELVFEHRNYFAGLGLLIAVAALALRGLQQPPLRRWVVPSVCAMLLAQAAITSLRAYEWGDPLRLAQAEASRNPASPRAVYELGRQQYAIADGDASSPAFAAAMGTFAAAARLPGASALPLQALLVATASSGQEADAATWNALRARLRDGPMDRQTIAALQSLARCQLEGRCQFRLNELVATFVVAVNREPVNPEILAVYAYLAQAQLGDYALALELLQRATEIDANNPIRWHQLGQTLALIGRYDAAEQAAAEIDRLDRWGRYRSKSDALRGLIQQLRQQPRVPAPGSG